MYASNMYASNVSMSVPFSSKQAFPAYDSNDIKELEFKYIVSQGHASSCYGDWPGFQPTDCAAMQCSATYSDYVWSDGSAPVQSTSCQRCGAYDLCTNGNFDTSTGVWYCFACWQQIELINALSSDDEESDAEGILPQLAGNIKPKKESDDEDGVSTAGSTQADIPSSSESDAECKGKPHGAPDSSPMPTSRISLTPSPGSWAAKMRLRREQRSSGAHGADVKIDDSSSLISGSSRPTPAWASLQASPTSWGAQMKLRRQTKDGVAEVETKTAQEMARSARAVLNKLTADSFERLCLQLVALIAVPFFTEEHLAALVKEIFGKAITDHAFCPLYADLCVRLDACLSERGEAIGGIAFRTVLQTECQTIFERDLCGSNDRAALADLQGDALYEMEVKLKCSRIGNVRFMGELLLRKLLPADMVLVNAKELLHTAGDSGSAIESLVALLQVISPKFDSFGTRFTVALKEVYATLGRRTACEQLPVRIRFLIRDLLDLVPKECLVQNPRRDQGWTPRHSAAVWKPKLRQKNDGF